jgi:predicted  nucleic acid-binding Zn-ribbon protein
MLDMPTVWCAKMAEDVVEEIENALNLVVTTTEQSSIMRKTLKEKIYQTVSTLRHLLTKLTNSCEQKSSDIQNLTKKIGKLESQLQGYKDQQQKRQQAPSIENNDEQGEKLNERQVAPSMDKMQQPSNSRVRQLPPLTGGTGNFLQKC